MEINDMFQTFGGNSSFPEATIVRAKSCRGEEGAAHLRRCFILFVQALPNDPTIIEKLGIAKAVVRQAPLRRKNTQENKQGHPQLETEPPQLRLHYRTSIEERLDEEDSSIGSFSLSSGLLVSAELSEPPSEELLMSRQRLTVDHLEELFGEKQLEVGFTALLLLCKYFITTGRAPSEDTMLRLFVAASLVAFKLSYELISNKFSGFLSALINADSSTVNALERHFVKSLHYDLQISSHSLKKLMALLVQHHA